ncbi:MAG: endonuclease MutS2 [Anaerolineae bacterium]|jgi:DNA mismatch repair protein MutS2|nr:endonuclease MutS2 [Anaerolineae bacterium]MDH7475413.1 endonuclease MutS2 [Anaerolineae bacterium]
MDTKYLQTLELPKILERVAEYASFSAGRELILALQPTSDLEEARRRQGETREALYLIDSQGGVSLGGVYDVRPLVDGASRGVTLLPGDLLDVRSTLLRGQSLKRTITRQAAQLPLLAAIAARIEPCPHVAAEIGRCINDQAEVVDTASPRLAQIRRDLKIAHDRLLDKLNRLVTSPETATYLQEAFVTQRNGRYVIPLKADFKGRIPGLVHDTSASGATLFIEPLATVELNNRWRELQIEEEREVQRILAELSGLVAQEGEFIVRTVEALAELDLALAKAEYAHATRSIEPELVPFKTKDGKGRKQSPPDFQHPGSTIKLLRARHPLLDPATVVPIDVYLDDDYFVLVITGPNTGGKTVSLKTVGLLTLMAQAGLHIPAAEGSALSVFEGVYADIGDEQSIEQSLSTFSSHMSNIIRVLNHANERSLVLLDELGAGTDPSEGSALARAILSHLVRRRITTLATTHSSELKVYAHSTPGVQNASVEFDLETLSPTYELTIGLPGRSNAFAIATRLGLPQEIVEEAKGLVTPEGLEAEALLAEIKVAREEALAAREAARAAQLEAEKLAEQLRLRLATIEEERRAIVNQAREEARQELESVRAELRRVRARLASALLSVKERPPELAEAEQTLDELAAQAPPLEKVVLPEIGVPAGPLAIGDTVWVAGLGVTGEIEELSDDGATVRVGSFRVRARREMLELRRREPPPPEELTPPEHPLEALPPSPGIELDLRGLRVEEALGRVDQHLNAAFLAGLPFVRIVHGKGTGALRRAVRQALDGHSLVASFRPGEEGEGGDGVTVAYLANS